ncbi:MAG: glycosyl transferase [Bacteroidota bacterium]
MELATAVTYSAADLARAASPSVTLTGAETTATVSAAGTGVVTHGGLDLTRWRSDAVEDADGLAVYLRDLASGRVWTVGWRPGQGEDRYEARFGAGTVEIVREDDGIETRLCLAVAASGALVGRVELRALDGRDRQIELTTVAEVVLHDRAADAAHPAFSKLFVETEAMDRVLVARRRPRSPEDAPAFLAHWLDAGAADVSWETDRLAFAGRGRLRRQPLAMETPGPLAGTVGAVLDPVVALRTIVEVAAGESVTRAFGLVGGRSRGDVLDTADQLATVEAVESAIQAAADAAPEPEVEETHTPAPLAKAARQRAALTGTLDLDDGALRQFNGIGGFSEDGTEYVMHLRPGAGGQPELPPLPWCNVIATEHAGFVVSERGTASSWTANSRENRLTPWANDPVEDPGEALYVQDTETGAFWSPTPGPAPAHAPYEVRHGFGYSTWRTVADGIEQVTTQSIAPDTPARLTVVRLTNASGRPRQLAVTAAARFDLGSSNTPRETTTRREGDVLFARNPCRGEFSDRVAVARALGGDVSLTADRAAFLGRFGTDAAPLAVVTGGPLDGSVGERLDHAAFRVAVELAPGETCEVAFVLGEGGNEAEAAALAERFGGIDAVHEAIGETRRFWVEVTSAIQIETPEPALDLVVNGWLVYQNLACRMWGRTAYYQSGGAYGFRDQLQDASALVYARPDVTRAQILRNASHQFEEGDVLHWWHPPLPKGIRTRFADDLLWLPLLAADYAATTGDDAVFNEDARFLTARPLADGEDEVFLQPNDAGTSATLYEHCARAIDRSLRVGAHGLPLMGVGDWNDGMNRVGREGRGESVWMGFFLTAAIDAFLPYVEACGDHDRAERYRQHRADLRRALDADGWDGAWYRRAFYDNGAVMGSAESDECQIDALVQAWSVLTSVAPADRARQALDAMEARLVDEDAGIVRLLDPPFDVTPNDPGYIKGYVPGVRENGGQYTHAALWAVRALAEAGRCERAAPLLAMLSPVRHADTPAGVARYKTEPYVVAADVYGVAPHVGRGGWTWYTGSAGWMWRVAVESILGFGLDRGEAITLRPCVPAGWPGFALRYRLPGESGTTYSIRVTRGDSRGGTIDGDPLAIRPGDGWHIPLEQDGNDHEVVLTLV